MAALLCAKDLCKTYVIDKRQNNVLKNVNLEVKEGEMVAIMGPSGSGKSTLLYAISGMDRATSGQVLFEGKDLTKLSEKELAKIIPDSEWVRINYDGDDYYVIGRLRDEGKVKYLGYGVPGREDVKPPKVAEGIASWIPTEEERGYWIFFQSASTGEIDNV